MISVYLDRDTEKSHGINLCVGRGKGINFGVQWRSWEPNDSGYDPWMLAVRVFVWGTFLGARPFSDTWLGRRCCSNGVTLLNWSIWR